MVADLIAVQKNKQALRRERNKVEVFEGKFRSLKFFWPQKENKLLHVTRLIKTATHVFA